MPTRDNFSIEDNPEIASRNYRDVHYPMVLPVHSGTKAISKQFPLPASGDLLERISIRRGEVAGLASVSLFGRNTDVDLAAAEDIWDSGGTYPFVGTATSVAVVSTSTSDTAAGAGARIIQIYGLDGDYNMVTEELTLNGTTVVNSANAFLRIYHAKVISSGASGVNVGSILGSSPGFSIPVGAGQTSMAVYTVPAGKTAYVSKVVAAISNSTGATYTTVVLNARPFGTNSVNKVYQCNLYNAGTSALTRDFDAPIVVPEKTDIWFSAATSRNDTVVNVGIDMILVDG